MKKSMWILTLVVMVAGAGLAYAEHDEGAEGHGMMGGMGKCHMMGGMMNKSMVATSDGGVVVLAGQTITKYDKNLNVVKEAQIKMDKSMMKDCPMKDCPMMKGKGGKNHDADKAEETEEAPAAVTEDHTAHH
jgi:hypothetical protein